MPTNKYPKRSKKFTCRKCFNKFNTWSELFVHLQKHKSKSIKFSNVHQSKKHLNKPKLALDNGYTNLTQSSRILVHKLSKPSHLENVKTHERIHSKEKRFQCDQCKKKFTTFKKFNNS